MNTLAETRTRDELVARLRRLQPDSPRQWGTMDPHQMVCHLTDGFRLAAGERTPGAVDTVLTRTLVRWVALHTPLQWPHGAKTVPEADQVAGGGTPPAEWGRDTAELARRIGSFHVLRTFPAHPIFGPLTLAEWGVWGFRHVDHHLRQFLT